MTSRLLLGRRDAARQAPDRPSDRPVRRRTTVVILGCLVALAAAPFGLAPYALSVLTLGLVYGLLTYGLDLAWGRVGLLSVGQAAFFGTGAYAVAIGADAGLPAPLAAAGGVAAAVLLAGVIALVALSVPGETAVPLFILLTLGIGQLLERTATTVDSVTGGANGLAAPPLDLVGSYYLVLGVVVVAVALTHRLVVRGRRGAFQLAVLVNPVRAEHLGVNPRSTQAAAFMVSGAVSAAAGALFAPVAGLVTPATLGLGLSTSVLTWLAVGGRGSLLGPFLGAVALTVGAQALGGTWRSWYVFALAAVFVLVIQVAPTGVAGLARTVLARGRDVPTVPSDAKPARRGVSAGVAGAPLLHVDRVSQRFGRSLVLREVSLTVERGRCVCLIGPNGAGKSTLLSVVTGHLGPSSGQVLLRGQDVTTVSVAARARLGVGRLFQVPSVFDQLTIADNLRLAALATGSSPASASSGPAGTGAEITAGQRSATGELTTAGELSTAERRHLELDMVLTGPPDLVLLDEPAAGLNREDAHALARRLRQVVTDSGCGMVVVEHDMEIVRELADEVVVLAGGEVIASGSMDEIVAHDAVRNAYLGEG